MKTFDFSHLPLTGWYPGHMLKAGRRMRELLSLVDLVVELVDSRAPLSTRNPKFRKMLPGKAFVLVMNKADLADPAVSDAWQHWWRKDGITSSLVDSSRPGAADALLDCWRRTVEADREERGARSELNRPVRVMIAGIPNVGKSTLVNSLYAGRRAEVGPKPGVTRQTQWTPLKGNMELLDTPGVLWPRIRDKTHELRLALLGSIRDELVGPELIAEYLWAELAQQAPEKVAWDLYDLESAPDSPYEFMQAVASRRGYLRGGGRIDEERTAAAVLKDFRDGRLGRLTLQKPPEFQPNQEA